MISAMIQEQIKKDKMKEYKNIPEDEYEDISSAIDLFFQYLERNKDIDHNSVSSLKQAVDTYLKVPLQVIMIAPDGEVYYEKINFTGFHITGLQRLALQIYFKTKDEVLKKCIEERSEKKLIEYFCNKGYLYGKIFYDQVKLQTVYISEKMDGNYPKRNMAELILKEEFLVKNDAIQLPQEDDFIKSEVYIIPEAPKHPFHL